MTHPVESRLPPFPAAGAKRSLASSICLPFASYATAVRWIESLAATTSRAGVSAMRATGDALSAGSGVAACPCCWSSRRAAIATIMMATVLDVGWMRRPRRCRNV